MLPIHPGDLRGSAGAALALCTALWAYASSAAAQMPASGQRQTQDTTARVRLLRPGELRYSIGRADSPNVRVERLDSVQDWIVELTAAPRLAPGARVGEAEAQRARLHVDLTRAEAEAARALPGVRAIPGVTVRYEYGTLLNGMAIRAPGSVARSLRALPYVRAVNEDRPVHLLLDQSVPLIQADQAWALGFRGDGQVIAIIDSGIDYHHPALGGGFGPGFKVIGGWDFVNDDADPMDDHGHGTHVAGIAAGNGGGITGVAPGAKLLAYKAMAANGEGTVSGVIAALERAADPDGNPATHDGADVVSMSLGAPGTPDDAMSRAVDVASAAGMVVVVAAGNDGRFSSIESPGAARSAITVGSSSKADVLSGFSSRGPTAGALVLKPDVTAPGEGIRSAALGGGTVPMSGTSMAAPHVAGVAALVRQAHPAWSPAQVKAAIVEGARDLGQDYLAQGAGRVDARRSVAPAAVVLPAAISLGAVGGGGSLSRRDTLTVVNPGMAPRTYALVSPDAPPGVTLTISPASVTLAPGGSARVYVNFGVDGDGLRVPPYPYASSGHILAVSAGDTARVAYVVMAARLLAVAYAPEPEATLVHDRRGTAVATYYPGPRQDLLVPRDAERADVIAQFGSHFVVKENQPVAGGTPITANMAEATIERRIQGRDEAGAAVDLHDVGLATRLVWTGAAPLHFDMCGLYSVTQFYFSPVSTAYHWQWAAVLDRNYKAYRFGATERGMTISGVSENPAGQLLHKVWRITLPDTAKAYWTHSFIGWMENGLRYGWGYGPVSSLAPLHDLHLYRAAATLDGPVPLDFLAMDTFPTRWNMNSATYLLSADGDTVRALSAWYGTMQHWVAVTDTIPVMYAPVRWNGHLGEPYGLAALTTDDGLSFFPSQTGDEANARGQSFRLLSGGTLLQQDTIYAGSRLCCSWPVSLRSGAFTLQVMSQTYGVGAVQVRATATLDFDGRRSDYDPPRLTRLQFMARSRFVDAVYPGIDLGLRISARDSGGVSTVTAAVRLHGGVAWTDVPLVADTGDWRGTLPIDGTTPVDIRVELTDRSGNRLSYVLEPALGTTSAPPAEVTLETASSSPADTLLSQAIDLSSSVRVNRFAYGIAYGDPLGLLTFSGAVATGRAAGATSTAEFDPATATVTGDLEDFAQGISAGTGRVLEHRFRVPRDTAFARRVLGADVGAFRVDAPADADRGSAHITYRVSARTTTLDLRNTTVVPAGSPGPGWMQLALGNGDVDQDGRIDDRDVSAIAGAVFDSTRLRRVGRLLGDIYPDGRIDVYDVVRAARLAAGKTAVDSAAAASTAGLATCSHCDVEGAPLPARLTVTGAVGRYHIRITATRPISGAQLSLSYDPAAVQLGAVSLDVGATGFRLVPGPAVSGARELLIYSPSGGSLPLSDVALLTIEASTLRSGAAGSALKLVGARMAGPDGRAIPFPNSHLEGLDAPIPGVTAIGEPYPNPFSGVKPLHLPVDVAGEGDIRMRAVVYGIRGERVRTLVDDVLPPGRHVVDWDGRNDRDQLVSSGIYILVVDGPGLTLRRRLVFVR